MICADYAPSIEELTAGDSVTYGVKIRQQCLDDLTEEERRLLVIILQERSWSVNLPYAAQRRSEDKDIRGKRSRTTIRRRFERAGQRLEHRGLIDVRKMDDGLTWFFARPPELLDLIRRSAKFQQLQKSEEPVSENKESRSPFAVPRNASGLRLNAIRHLQGIRMVRPGDDRELRGMFGCYLSNINEQIITLIHRGTGEVAGLEYSTRFNDQRKVVANLDRYDYAMDLSADQHFRAVFLTLTTDPKMFKNNWEANRNMTKAWNKFLSFLTRRLKGRPKYISSFEFTKSGLIHVHAIIYVPFLIKKDEITKAWMRCGQGKINYIYRLKSRNGKWLWAGAKERPPDAKTGDAGTYLKKYLKKCLFATRDGSASSEDTPLYMFWAINKRFWTSSRCFLPPPGEKKEVTEHPDWSFLGVIHEDIADQVIDSMFYERKDAPAERPPWLEPSG